MSHALTNAFLDRLTQTIDRRREAITMIRRTVRTLDGTVYLDTGARMAIPMVYAHWEGYVREVLQLYLEHLEELKVPQVHTSPHLLAYSWSQNFRGLMAKSSVQHRADFTRRILASIEEPVAFHKKEKQIDMGSNLRFSVLDDLCTSLCLDVAPLRDKERALDALVDRRNTIAHGGRHEGIGVTGVDKDAQLVLDLMGVLESLIRDAVVDKRYLAHTKGGDANAVGAPRAMSAPLGLAQDDVPP